MKKIFLGAVAVFSVVVLATSCQSKQEKPVSAAFYNVENLFDTIDNPLTRDNDFLPTSKVAWNTERYNRKLKHIAKVMSSMEPGSYPTLFGLAEVENRTVVEDLIHQKSMVKAGYKILHKDSPDERGIDVALLYRPDIFRPVETQFIALHFPSEPNDRTRDILYSKGVVYGKDTLHVFVNHWVSRYGGQDATDTLRRYTGYFLKNICDSIMQVEPKANIIIMGDLNDDPTNYSLVKSLGALQPTPSPVDGALYNLAAIPFSQGKGSLYYKSWDLFDQIIVSAPMLDGQNGIQVNSESETIFKKDWMLFKRRDGVMVPNRTESSRSYFGGYSDHLPVMIGMEAHD
ncbi:MAG: endonuclease/exonuclease/phosphatase family protein [Bacteroidales bacterium]|nr:endonuclease/exonuclease/phosphatase family protein [Bacteroidales bacterium]